MKNMIRVVCLMVCMILAGASGCRMVKAEKISSLNQAEKKALKEVKDAVVTDTDMDIKNGETVYEVTLFKGTKEYEIVYRAKDGKKMEYSWEDKDIASVDQSKTLSKKQCKKLAKAKVKGATLLSLTSKTDDGVSVYKVKLKKGSKKYTLEYLVNGKKLIEYKWELTKNQSSSSQYIGASKAKSIALEKVPGGNVTECKFEKDDGVPVYEVEIICDGYEYEITIHAKSGKVLEMEKDYMD
ncbi:MAG: PepSY domain-containing protein [Lachnospira sp.]|nr:PepSY domain-containing protein [Lachnospira sp.]